MREWDCGTFNKGKRFFGRITVREVADGYQVIEVLYDRDAGMRKTETVIGTYQDLDEAKARGWQISSSSSSS